MAQSLIIQHPGTRAQRLERLKGYVPRRCRDEALWAVPELRGAP